MSRSAREGEADVEQRRGLALALDRRDGAVALAAGQAADDDTDDEQEEQVQPLGRIADRERVERLDEEEVVDEERADRRRDGRPGAAQDGDGDDGQEVRRGRVVEPDASRTPIDDGRRPASARR